MQRGSDFTKYFFFIIVIIAILFGAFYFSQPSKDSKYSNEFAGGFTALEGDTVISDGSFTSAKNPEVAKDPKKVKILVDKNTKITKVLIRIPPEILAAVGESKSFNGADLKREESVSTLETMKADLLEVKSHVNIFAKTSYNVYGKDNFVASELKYEFVQ